MSRSILAFASAALALALAAAQTARADAPYPSKPIHIVIPFAGGSGSDTVGRLVGEALSSQMGVPIVADIKEGGGGSIGAAFVARAAPDGYTLLSAANPMTVTPHMMKIAPYDPVKDFVPITRVAVIPLVLVASAKGPYNTFDDFVARVRQSPGKINYATGGKGSPSHLEVELIQRALGLQMADVPYKNFGQGLTDTIAGRTDVMLASLPIAQSHIEAGNLRPLAVGSASRIPSLPNVPTLAEAMNKPGHQAVAWYGLVAPGGTPPEIVARLDEEIRKALASPSIRARIEQTGGRVSLAGAREFSAQVRSESENWSRVIKELNLTMD